MKKTLLLALLFVAGCGPTSPPPTPQPPPTLADRYVRFTVRGEDGHMPAGAVVSVNDDFGHVYPCALESDRANCRLDANIPQGDPATPDEVLTGGHRLVRAPDYQTFAVTFGFTGFSQDLSDVFLTPTFKPLVGIHPEGQHFRLNDGGRFVLAGLTDFNLLARYLNGEDIEPILAQRASLGFNSVRVFTAYSVPLIGRLSPKEHPDVYARIPAFLDHLAKHGLRAELVGFTGPYESFFANDNEKVVHWLTLCQAVAGKTNVTLELVNEGDHPANQDIPFARLNACDKVLSSHGSAVEDARPMEPFWSYVTFHPAAGEFQRKAGHNAMELWNGPTVSNEFSRSPDRDSNNQHWYDAGRNCALLAAGCVFHSVEGKDSRLLTGLSLENAMNFINGIRSIDLALCQDAPYHRRDDLLGPGVLRVHQRGTDSRCISAPSE